MIRGGSPDELERFKREVNLVEFAASYGYEVTARESSRSTKIMERGPDKICVALSKKTEHWIYWSVRDLKDNGTVIDFIQSRQKRSLGQVREELRKWCRSPPEVKVQIVHRHVKPSTKDPQAVALAVAVASFATTHPYLNGRGIRPETLTSERFAKTWKRDARNNAMFPHYNDEGLCGYELKNRGSGDSGFTGFAPQGEKGIWGSTAKPTDRRLVIAESAIDAISYHQLHPDPDTRYISIGGQPNPTQPRLIEKAIARMPAGSRVIAALDNDTTGTKLSATIQELADKHPHVSFERHSPDRQKDWNDVLKQKESKYIHSVTRRAERLRQDERGR